MRSDVSGRFKPGIRVITVIGLLNSAGFSISIPFLSLYLYQVRGLSMTAVGCIILGSGLCSAVAQTYSGVLTDRFGRRPVLLITVSAGILLQLVMAGLIAIAAPIVSIAMAYTAVRSALMMGRPAFSAMIADISPRERLAESYGMLRAGQNVGWASGPAVGGYLNAFLSYPWLFVFAGLMGMLTLIASLYSLRGLAISSDSAEVKVQSLFSGAVSRSLLEFMALGVLMFLVIGQGVSTMSVYVVDRAGFTTAQYGLLLSLNGILSAVLQYPVSRGLGRVTKANALVAGSLLYGLGYLIMSWVGGFPLAMGAIVIVSMGGTIMAPTLQAVVGELSPQDWRGRYMGLFGLSETIGISLGPLVGGILLDVFPTQPLFVWGTIFLLAVVSALGFRFWSTRRHI